MTGDELRDVGQVQGNPIAATDAPSAEGGRDPVSLVVERAVGELPPLEHDR
jgi:hypothetical protein